MSTKVDAVKHILEAIGLDEDAVKFLVNEQKINNFRRLVTMPEDTLKELEASSLDLLTRADVNEIRNLAHWDKEFYRKNEQCPTVTKSNRIHTRDSCLYRFQCDGTLNTNVCTI